MRASAADAVAAANRYTSYSVGYCLKWVVTCWQAPSIGCPSAIVSWEWALDKHPNDRQPPVGAPVYYRGGQYGHIAICTAPGRIRSTDCQGAGKVSEVNLDWPEKAWGYPYLGWAGDLSKVPLPLGGVGGDEDMTDAQFNQMMAALNLTNTRLDSICNTQLPALAKNVGLLTTRSDYVANNALPAIKSDLDRIADDLVAPDTT
jgi:hypothetical protein